MAKKRLIRGVGVALFGVLTLPSVTAVAQEVRSEISVQGTGFFTKDANGNGIRQQATDTGGFLLGYRYNINRWLAAEGNYGYDRNSQIYFGGTGLAYSPTSTRSLARLW